MDNLSKKGLIETYIKAKDLGLAEVFIKMVTAEINKRGITSGEITAFKEAYQEIKSQK